MKEWTCIKVAHHKDVPKSVEDCEKAGWKLHTYTCAHAGVGEIVNHYLLFEREKGNKSLSSEAAAAAAAAAAT